MRTVWPRWVAGLAAAGLLLSGCGGLPRTEATPEGVEELAILVAECHSPGDAGCSEEEDEGWGRWPSLGTT